MDPCISIVIFFSKNKFKDKKVWAQESGHQSSFLTKQCDYLFIKGTQRWFQAIFPERFSSARKKSFNNFSEKF